MDLIFFVGYHGAGKTYTANQLISDGFNAYMVDCGPIIRNAFSKSGFEKFDDWIKYQETTFGNKWDDIILLETIKTKVLSLSKKPKYLFIIGNRNIDTIMFSKTNLSNGKNDKIIFINRSFEVMKFGYETRMKKELSNDEFAEKLRIDDEMGLSKIKEYIAQNPENNHIFELKEYNEQSIREVGKFILGLKLQKNERSNHL